MILINVVLVVAGSIASLIILGVAFHRLIFLRNPEREIPKGKNIVSPADGKVIDIIEFKGKDIKIEKGMLGKIKTLTKDIGSQVYIISIFMSPLDVHYNRGPVSGEILSVKHEKGKFLPVMSIANGLVNEKNEVVIKNKDIGKIKVIQIAGFLARRIECFVKKGKKIEKGERFGLINLGSQATIIFSKKKGMKIKVSRGDKVKGGSTILATY